ncbi:hypothetical protein EPI10_005661 [Gossypium australe]|uniref:Uncharacterized protein n=1 Tax=Gossypium australe TaxID=47621 RepID=A0A5B6WNQ8_9ROSI|nr:hypothetical protein EPI10_005661 [Gossypium australe]
MAKNDALIYSQAATLKIWRTKWTLRSLAKRTLEPKEVEVKDELAKGKENQPTIELLAPQMSDFEILNRYNTSEKLTDPSQGSITSVSIKTQATKIRGAIQEILRCS